MNANSPGKLTDITKKSHTYLMACRRKGVPHGLVQILWPLHHAVSHQCQLHCKQTCGSIQTTKDI